MSFYFIIILIFYFALLINNLFIYRITLKWYHFISEIEILLLIGNYKYKIRY